MTIRSHRCTLDVGHNRRRDALLAIWPPDGKVSNMNIHHNVAARLLYQDYERQFRKWERDNVAATGQRSAHAAARGIDDDRARRGLQSHSVRVAPR